MREHRYSFEMPHSAARIWALFQDYDRWTDYAPMVKRVDVLWPGDEHHNGRLRRVIYQMPFGREGSALELVTDVEPERGYTYTMISRDAGNDQTGKVRLEPIGPNRTRFSFEERYHLTKAPWKWFEGPIYGFINKKNEEIMRRASEWLTAHPEYRADLVEPDAPAQQRDERGADVADRPKALVTAPFRGEGLDTLARLADVVLRPVDRPQPLRLYNAEQLAERVEGRGRRPARRRDRLREGPGPRPAARRHRVVPGRPQQRRHRRRHRQGASRCCGRPGRNADAVAELAVALLFAVNRGVVRADLDVREGEIYRDGTIPYQRFRAWQLAGQTAGLVGLGAVGRATQWRLEGLGMRVIAYDPYAPDATHSLDDLLAEADVVSMHAAVTPETRA